ncbi:MAG: hypothetical protein CEN92_72, partial [Candidatus Berkelbacteria bacterium Licking1014_96]
KYQDLNKSPEVESAAKRTDARAGEEVSIEPKARIQNYLDRLKEIIEQEDLVKKERGLEALKGILNDKYVIKAEKVPESYFESVKRRHREEGHGDIEIPEEQKEQLKQTIITDQVRSLDMWVDYLASPDAKYPDYLKYFAFRSILRLGRYDKEKKAFSERRGGAVSPFPDLNREALGFILDALEKQERGKAVSFAYDIQEEEKQEFNKFLQRKNFAKLYAWAIDKINPVPEDLMRITQGEWRKFPQGSDPKELVRAIQDYATGWCIRGEGYAEDYLRDNDELEIYFSNDQDGQPRIPRVVIVRNEESTKEVRGVADQENLDPYIGEVVAKKLEELPDGKLYAKKSADMKRLTAIERKIQNRQELNKDDLIFLYEIKVPIEGFGYQKDPRIKELISQRDPKVDAPIVFGCKPSEIAWGENQINESTKAYIGPLFKGIFQKLSHLEHIYTSFPEGRIVRSELVIGGKTAQELEQELREQKINISNYARGMLRSNDFTTLSDAENIDLVRLKVCDLGVTSMATTKQIYTRAEEFGLELCPTEVGPHQRLKDLNQSLGDWYWVGMKPIAGRGGRPIVLDLSRDADGLWLGDDWADPAARWDLASEIVFRSRPPASPAAKQGRAGKVSPES